MMEVLCHSEIALTMNAYGQVFPSSKAKPLQGCRPSSNAKN